MKQLMLVLMFTFSFLNLRSQTIEELYKDKKYQKVIDLALKKDSLTSLENYRVGRSYYNLENNDDALKYFDKALEGTCRDTANVHYFKGVVLKDLKEYDKSLISLEKAATMDSTDQYFLTEVGMVYMMKSDFNKAITVLEKAVLVKEENASPYFLLPYSYLLNNDKVKALALFNKYFDNIKKDEYRYSQALTFMSELERDNKNFKRAVELLQELLKINKENYDAIEDLIVTHNRAGDYKQGDKVFINLRKNYEEKHIDERLLKSKSVLVDKFYFNDTIKVLVVKYFEKPKEFADPIYKSYIVNTVHDSTILVVLTEKTIGGFGIDHMLCGWKGSTHLNFGKGFKGDDLKLKEFEDDIVGILNKRLQVAASSTSSKKKD
jgi:tetratricopeptide (TPR) repeat protein